MNLEKQPLQSISEQEKQVFNKWQEQMPGVKTEKIVNFTEHIQDKIPGKDENITKYQEMKNLQRQAFDLLNTRGALDKTINTWEDKVEQLTNQLGQSYDLDQENKKSFYIQLLGEAQASKGIEGFSKLQSEYLLSEKNKNITNRADTYEKMIWANQAWQEKLNNLKQKIKNASGPEKDKLAQNWQELSQTQQASESFLEKHKG